MLKKKFFNKPDTKNPKNDAPDEHDENPEAVKEEITEGTTETESEINDIPDTTENVASEEMTDEFAEDPEEEAVALKKELSELHDKYLRLAAEYDNYRKRTLREKMDLIQNAGESLLMDILPVVDDFERGIEVASNAEDMDAVRTGMDLIYNKLKDFLANHGLKEIKAMNEPFDTDWHEAVTNIPAPSDDMKGKVIDVIQKGYTLNNKVMRYSKVVIGE